MYISEIKPIGKVGKNLLEINNPEELIELIIEKPLRKACTLCKQKNIETVMSSCNKKNIMKDTYKIVNKQDVIKKLQEKKILTFQQAGKGYAWIMFNYNTLSDKNKEIFYSLEKELGEEFIWFVKTNYFDSMNKIRKVFKLNELNEGVSDNYNDTFNKKALMLMYNNKYPSRAVFIRMPINNSTKCFDVETYFDNIINRLSNQ